MTVEVHTRRFAIYKKEYHLILLKRQPEIGDVFDIHHERAILCIASYYR